MEGKQTRRSEPLLTTYLFSKAGAAKIPLSGTFELSPVCNFSCRMCYVRKSAGEVQHSERPLLTREQWLSIAEQARDAGMLYLLLTGGEPLLHPDFWEIYEKLVRMGLLVSVNTNGSLIDDAAIERFRALPPNRINITLYGASDETYESLCGAKGVYSKVTNTIERLKAAGLQVKLNGTLTPQNVGDLEKNIRWAEARGLLYEPAAYMFPPVRRDESMIGQNERFTPQQAAYYDLLAYRLQHGEERYQNRLASIRRGAIPPPGLDEHCVDPADGKIRCRAGKACFWITWDGWMTPCGMMTQPHADIVQSGFSAAWQEITERSAKVRLSGVCESCRNRELCHACAAMALAETGSADGIPRYLCHMAEAMKRLAEEQTESGKADLPLT